MARPKTLYRIVGGQGEWFAFHHHLRVEIWMPHAVLIILPTRRDPDHLERVIQGKTPSEALYRLKQALREVG
jgi:hypothetical protein